MSEFDTVAGVVNFADHMFGSREKTKFAIETIESEGIVNKLNNVGGSQHYLHFEYSSYEILLELHRHGGPEEAPAVHNVCIICTCPAASGREQRRLRLCEHGLAALLWRLPDSEKDLLKSALAAAPPPPPIKPTATLTAALSALDGDDQGQAPGAPSSTTGVPKMKGYRPQSLVRPQLPEATSPAKKKPTSPQRQKQPKAVGSRRGRPIKQMHYPRRWMSDKEMMGTNDAMILENSRKLLGKTVEPEEEPLEQQRPAAIQRRPPQQQQQQQQQQRRQQEEPSAPMELDVPAPSPPTAAATNPAPPTEDVGAAAPPPAPPTAADNNDDDDSFLAHFLKL